MQRIKKFEELVEENEEQGNNSPFVLPYPTLAKTIQFQKAKIEALAAELDRMSNIVKVKESQIEEIESKGKSISEESKKYVNQITQLNEKLEVTRKQLAEVNHKFETQNRELVNIKKV
jgi:peptidoglycan hydrolase CwlO-like protein